MAEMLATQDALSRWDKPALVAFSDTDPVFPFPRAGERFTELIPTAGEQVRIEGARPLPPGGPRPADRRRHARRRSRRRRHDADRAGRAAVRRGGRHRGRRLRRPVVMLNLNRYRERAEYDGRPARRGVRDVSGREAYMRYGAVAAAVLERVGGRILWHTDSQRHRDRRRDRPLRRGDRRLVPERSPPSPRWPPTPRCWRRAHTAWPPSSARRSSAASRAPSPCSQAPEDCSGGHAAGEHRLRLTLERDPGLRRVAPDVERAARARRCRRACPP